MEEARKEVEHARNRQREAAISLDSVIAAAKASGTVEQVRGKVNEYLEKIEAAEKSIAEAQAKERLWHQEVERGREIQQEEPPLKSGQEALVDMMQRSLQEQLEEEMQSRIAEGLPV